MLPASKVIARQLPMAILYTALGVGLKGIGSAFRIKDLSNAPDAVKDARVRQETALLSLVGVVTLAAQAALPLAFRKFNLSNEFGKNLVRSAMIAPGYIASEALSRKFGNVSWNSMMENSGLNQQDAPTRNKLRQLTNFLFQPEEAHSTQAFGNTTGHHPLYNPYNRSAASLSTPAMVGQRLDTTALAPAVTASLLPFSASASRPSLQRSATPLATVAPLLPPTKGRLQI